MKSTKVIVTVYSHPEYYPPTLNMIEALSKRYNSVFVLSRNVFKSDWVYAENVNLFVTGNFVNIRESESKSLFKKLIAFLSYTSGLLKLLRNVKPDLLVLCDPIPTLSYRLIRVFKNSKTLLWYHNHDVLEKDKVNFLSVSYFSYFSEKAIFKELDIFTLPSEDRKKYFYLDNFKGRYFFLPNYPSVNYFSRFPPAKCNKDVIRLIYQGSIGQGHALEEMIDLLKYKINGKTLYLVLKGFCSAEFKSRIHHLASELDVLAQVEFHGVTSYHEVPKLTGSCQIGLAIYKGNDLMNLTLGTSSNKIYEYAALGLPVILYESEQFKKYLSKYPWCFFTTAVKESLKEIIEKIDNNYTYLNQEAKSAINSDLNFEYYFEQIQFN